MSSRGGSTPPTIASARALAARLERVRASLLDLERSVDLSSYGPQGESARNLLDYLAFRHFDLRRDQSRLAQWGLSSLGRSESHVLYNLDAVLGWLDRLSDSSTGTLPISLGPDPQQGQQILQRNARSLLGPRRAGRSVRMMVTMPAEAATDYRLVRDLVESGMDCARINCAHDGPGDWSRMISHIRRAARETRRRCRIEMDLPGPKIRTGAIRPGPSVLRIKPTRDVLGQVKTPGSVWLVPLNDLRAELGEAKAIPLPNPWLLRRRLSDRVEFQDARGARRRMRLVERVGLGIRAELEKSAYLTPGTRLVAARPNGKEDSAEVGPIPPVEQRIHLRPRDRLIVTARPVPGEEARRDARGKIMRPAHIACTFPKALRFVRRGEPIWLDDGQIGGIVRSSLPERLTIEVTHAPPEGTWLGADKGINLPETDLNLPPIPPEDMEDLRFIVRHADLVGFSFVHSAADLEKLRAELARLGRPRMGIVVKVETRKAFEELPGILLEALRQPPVGVMIARGDLAVEIGFDRLAEVQEEILWLCEAAHVPAIWATQVLEGLAKNGLPSRAEVTDAAMGERAECVMLNKGPHIVEAVQALDSILRRMQSHQAKKTAMLRHLNIVERFVAERRIKHPQ
jgi:pyruvate kinase